MVLDELLDRGAAAAVGCPQALQARRSNSLCAARSDLGPSARQAPGSENQSEMPSDALCLQLSIVLPSETAGHTCTLWDALRMVEWVLLLLKEMLLSRHRVIVATLRRAPPLTSFAAEQRLEVRALKMAS